MSQIKELSPEEFRRMQLLQTDMLAELDRVCRKHGIRYCIAGGTMLGAVRHKGYIPWDDDADVAMLREEYEKFKLVAHEMDPEICYFQDHENDPGYRWGYGKLRRTGTTYVRVGQEHLTNKTGVFVDVFPLDDVPKSVPGQIIQDFRCFVLRKILYSEVGRLSDSETAFSRFIYRLLSKIPVSRVYRRVDRMAKKSRNDSPVGCRTLLFPSIGKMRKHPLSQRFGVPKAWFFDAVEYDFEGLRLFGARDYDAYLSFEYGDYMVLPPEEQRVVHAPVSDYHF